MAFHIYLKGSKLAIPEGVKRHASPPPFDLEELVKVCNAGQAAAGSASYEKPDFSVPVLSSYLENPGIIVWGTRSDGTLGGILIGTIVVETTPWKTDRAFVVDVLCSSVPREKDASGNVLREGYGTLLMNIVEQTAQANGFAEVRLIAAKSAKGFYSKLGYQQSTTASAMMVKSFAPKEGAPAPVRRKVAYAVGRFQPPTIGHQRLIREVMKQGGDAVVFVSKLQNYPDNPLSSELKVRALNEMFPRGVTFVDTAKCPTPCGGPVAAHAYLRGLGYTDITLVAGSDRARDFNEHADMWKAGLAQDPPIQPPRFVGVERETHETGAASMSGTKARAMALEKRKADFQKAVNVGSISHYMIHELYTAIRDAALKSKTKGGTRRRPRSNKASGRALSRRGSRSRTVS